MMNFSGDFPTQGPLIIWTSVLLCVVAAALVAFRFWQIYGRKAAFGLEDYTVATSLVSGSGMGAKGAATKGCR